MKILYIVFLLSTGINLQAMLSKEQPPTKKPPKLEKLQKLSQMELAESSVVDSYHSTIVKQQTGLYIPKKFAKIKGGSLLKLNTETAEKEEIDFQEKLKQAARNLEHEQKK